jgi:hypothetical protein
VKAIIEYGCLTGVPMMLACIRGEINLRVPCLDRFFDVPTCWMGVEQYHLKYKWHESVTDFVHIIPINLIDG